MNRALYIIYILFSFAIYDTHMLRQTEKLAKLPSKCGVISAGDKVTNGRDAGLGQFPFMALLGYTENVSNFSLVQFICGGTLISEEYVLTAAHCFQKSLTFVRLGELDLKSDIDCSTIDDFEECGDPYLDVPIDGHVIHANYNGSGFQNDIALTKLARKVSFTHYIKPICLPLDNNYNNLIKSSLIVTGWGRTISSSVGGSSVLQYAMVNTWSKKVCENVLAAEVRPLKETQFCANGLKGQDACSGDSGGPLFATQPVNFVPAYIQVGIVSFGATSGCGNRELPSVYTRVDKYIDWILENI